MTQKLKVLWSREYWVINVGNNYPPYQLVEINKVDNKRTFCKECNQTRNTLAYKQDLGLDRYHLEFDELICLDCTIKLSENNATIITQEIPGRGALY